MSDSEYDDFMNTDDELEDDDASDFQEDLGFSSVVAEKDRKKAYEVDFTILSVDDIITAQNKEVNHVAGILGLSDEHAAVLLRYFRWNKERLIERCMEARETILSAAGVISEGDGTAKGGRSRTIAIPGFVCDICCDDSRGLETVALSCNHRFCKNCYEHYLVQKIKEEGESRNIQCMASTCNVIVDEKTVGSLVDKAVYQRYKTLLLRTYVDDNEFLRWCPAPECEYAVECHVSQSALQTIVPTVLCRCSHRFCFGCAVADHQPCICTLVRKWLRKCEDDSETANWISAHTKECTKCRSTIEKNGGCNHMTCRKCKHEFCWVCMGPWSEHGTSWYNCNRYEEKSSTDARDAQATSRQTLERYLHYYNRFANHEQSAKLDRDLHHKTEKKMEELQQTSDLSWIEVQFLKKAVDILCQCRMTLKWTYAFAFYLVRNNATELFEDSQRDLEMATEQLSELLEKPIEPDKIAELKQQVLDKTVYVASRREVVLADTARGLVEGRWEYNVSLSN